MVFALEKVDPAEPPGVVQHDPLRAGAALHLEDHMVVQTGLRLFVMDAHRPRHAEMQQHGLAAVEREQQELATAAQRPNLPAGQPFAKARRQWPAQVRTPYIGIADLTVLHRGHQRPANRFNLGKFRHDTAPYGETQRGKRCATLDNWPFRRFFVYLFGSSGPGPRLCGADASIA